MKRPEEGGEVDPQEIFSKMFGGGTCSCACSGASADLAEAFYDYVRSCILEELN